MVEVMYTKEMPVDEFGRPGGMLSLSDLPISAFKTVTRKGTIENDLSADHPKWLWVTDKETGVALKVQFGDVKLIKQETKDV
tara:strand:+ start:388 stop:633 length:246 start_codon:yes stop_codon:yes gene_type:complete